MTKQEFEALEIGDCVAHALNLDLVLNVAEICRDERVINIWREKSNNPSISVIYKFEAGSYHTWEGSPIYFDKILILGASNGN